MTQFTAEGIGEAGGSPLPPISPVVDQTASIAIDALGKAVQLGAQFQQGKSASRAKSVVDRFTEEQILLADAVDQGAMGTREAKTRSRQNFVRYMSDNPGLSDALIERHGSILSKAGLGKAIEVGSEAEQQQVKAEGSAVSSGWASASDSDEIKAAKTAEHQLFLKATDKLKMAQATTSYAQSSLTLQENQKKVKATEALFNLSASYMPKLSRDVSEVSDRFSNGDISAEEAIQEVNLKWNEVSQIVNQVGGRAGGTYLKDLTAPMEQMKNDQLSYINGEMSANLLKSRNENAIALATQVWLAEPEVASIAAGQRLLHGSDMLNLLQDINPGTIKVLSKLTNPAGIASNLMEDDDAGKKEAATSLKLIRNNIKDVLAGTAVEGASEQVDMALKKALDSVDIYQSAVQAPEQFNNVVDFFASPEFGQMSVRKGGIDADKATKAKNVLTAQYESQVIPLLQEEYEKGSIVTQTNARSPAVKVNTADVIVPTFTGAGVSFIPKGGATGANASAIRQNTQRLNKTVAPVLNRMIRMTAHLSGDMNYKKAYEDNYVLIFGMDEPEGVTSDE